MEPVRQVLQSATQRTKRWRGNHRQGCRVGRCRTAWGVRRPDRSNRRVAPAVPYRGPGVPVVDRGALSSKDAHADGARCGHNTHIYPRSPSPFKPTALRPPARSVVVLQTAGVVTQLGRRVALATRPLTLGQGCCGPNLLEPEAQRRGSPVESIPRAPWLWLCRQRSCVDLHGAQVYG